jgi:dipeptidyl aminopeptidase/acylaminoacyl peptidase
MALSGMETIIRNPPCALVALFAAVTAWTAVACLIPCPADAAETAPLAAFGRLPSLEDVVISPDGSKFAFIKTTGDSRILAVAAVTKPEMLSGVRVGEAKLRALEWIDDDNLLITGSLTSPPPFGFIGPTSEWHEIINFNISRQKLDPITFAVSKIRTFNVITDSPSLREVSGRMMLYSRGYCVTNRTVSCLFSVGYPDRRARVVDEAGELGTEWFMDEAGNIAAQSTYQDAKGLWEIKTRKDGHWTLAASGTAAIDRPQVVGFSADGRGLIVQFVVDGATQWRPLNLTDNTWGPPLARGESFSRVIEDRKTGRILGGIREIGSSEYVFFDNELQAHWNAVLRAFPDERVELESHSDDFSRLVLKIFGPKDGYVFALYDWYSHHATILGRVYEEVVAPAERKAISYPAADGLTIPAFLTLPAGSAKDLPLVVLPHGGPASADTFHFDWWSQALAAQGYAVLQPNFRGSILNSKFLQAGFGEWGRKMQTDLSDGVRYLAHEGIIDPKRVCIVGASYGGYAALAGVTVESGVYRCAVSVAGLSDLRRFRNWTMANRGGLSQRYWDRFMGAADKNDPALIAISPIEHVAAVTVPVLLVHGRDDTVVPFEQSNVMLDALKRAGKSVTLVTMKHEDHWLSRSETRLQMLQATVDFLKANNPPN